MKVKTILVGDKAIGKTHLVSYLRKERSVQMYIPTIGVDLVTYSKSGTTLQIWDTSGSSKFKEVTNTFLRGSSLCIIVYNSTKSFQKVSGYLSSVDMLCERDYRVMVVCLSTDVDIVCTGKEFALRNDISFYQCNVFDRSSCIRFWHDVMHECERNVIEKNWEVDEDTTKSVVHTRSSFWNNLCFWR